MLPLALLTRALLATSPLHGASAAPAADVSFQRDVLPIHSVGMARRSGGRSRTRAPPARRGQGRPLARRLRRDRAGTLDTLLSRHGAALGDRPSSARVELVWGTSSAPLPPELAEVVLAGVQRHRELQQDARLRALPSDTVDHALKDEERHGAWAGALAALEAAGPRRPRASGAEGRVA